MELISEYTSSQKVIFAGYTGYKNFVGVLNTIASQYGDENYTTATRYFGYGGQTQYLNSYCTSLSCAEVNGGGDTAYQNDVNLVNNAVGTLVASGIGEETTSTYWLSGRRYYYGSSSAYFGFGRYIWPDGSIIDASVFYDQNSEHQVTGGIRPIVTVKANLSVIGNGTKEKPWKIN